MRSVALKLHPSSAAHEMVRSNNLLTGEASFADISIERMESDIVRLGLKI